MKRNAFIALLAVSGLVFAGGCSRPAEEQQPAQTPPAGQSAPGMAGQVSPQNAQATEQQMRQQKKGD